MHEEWVIAGQAGNCHPTPVFTSYMISTFYYYMPFAPISTINLVSLNAHYLQVAAQASSQKDAILYAYLLELSISTKDQGNFVFSPIVSSPLLYRDTFSTKYVQVGGGLGYKLTKW